jgi:hypothetical protein
MARHNYCWLIDMEAPDVAIYFRDAVSVTDARMSKFNALCGVAASQAAPMGDLITLPKKEG